MPITVRNPWSHNYVEVYPREITEARFDAMAQHMDDEARDAVNSAMAPCTPYTFFKAYAAKVGPEAAGIIWFS